MFDKINIAQIVRSHLDTLKNDNTKKAGVDDYLTFLVLPGAIAFALIVFDVRLNERATNIIITSLSILVGLLFNVIVLLFDLVSKKGKRSLKNRILKEVLANITFAVLLAIISIILTLLANLPNTCVVRVVEFCLYFLLSQFLLTSLMVLKRIYLLFRNEIDELERSGTAGNHEEQAIEDV
ncbi:MAG: hypothetical protein JSU02_03800 [Bacteroidetes bacterium]|nr:hypothetical protein [Bacteroidota bacterium]